MNGIDHARPATQSAKLCRRRFLRRSAVALGTLVAPQIVPPTVRGANERVVVGFIGTGARARQLMDHLPQDAARIVAISDCYIRRMEETLAEKKADWRPYQDYRKMLDTEKLDAVAVATPDHGRVLPCIHACQAGLDIYAEKPLTLTIAEGRTLVRAVRKYGRVFQVGSQQRTMEMNRFSCELVRRGGIGKLKVVLAVNYPGPRRYHGLPEEAIPEGDDWDMWQGQAPERPFNRQLQFNWMQWRAYSGGEMTNWGAHGCDQIQWALGMSHSGPVEIWPVTEGPSGKVSMRYANGVVVRYELERDRWAAPPSWARSVRSRSTVTSSRRIRPISSRIRLIRRSPSHGKAPAGLLGPTCRTGWIASGPAGAPTRTSKSAIDRSLCAIWPISPANWDANSGGIRCESSSWAMTRPMPN